MENSKEKRYSESLKIIFTDKKEPEITASVVWPDEDLEEKMKNHMLSEGDNCVKVIDIPCNKYEADIVRAMRVIDHENSGYTNGVEGILVNIAEAVRKAYSKP